MKKFNLLDMIGTLGEGAWLGAVRTLSQAPDETVKNTLKKTLVKVLSHKDITSLQKYRLLKLLQSTVEELLRSADSSPPGK